LVHHHDVGQREAEQVVELGEQRLEQRRERPRLAGAEVGQRAPRRLREYVGLVRVAREERDERDEVLVLPDDAAAVGDLLVPDRFEQVRAVGVAVLSAGGQLGLDPRRDERIGVDLAVRVRQRHADLAALVLEDEDVADELLRPELAVPVRPNVDQVLDATLRQRRERRIGVGRVDHDLANALRGCDRRQRRGFHRGRGRRAPQRREFVLEHHDVEVGRRDLGGEAAGPGRGRAGCNQAVGKTSGPAGASR
jgi:hypothetical protein